MLSWIKQLVAKPAASAPTPEHLKLEILKKDIPRYPPFMKGLPLEKPGDLVITQDELMRQLYQSSKSTKDVFQKLYQGAVDRFAEFVHLLPASQGHHHRGAGGLLRHSIEVGLWSLREADKMLLLDLCKTPGHRREIEPRWLLTAFLAGLCHDVGKPATDVLVRNHAGTKQWNPIEQSLWSWARKEGVDAYFLEWQPGRAKHHVAITGALAKNIITDETLAWISAESPQLFVWLMETLNGTPGNANPLFDIVIKADQKSVERDLKSMGAVMAGYDLGVPVERMLTDIMRRLIRQGIWSVNEPGAKVWCIDGNVYLVWPTSGQDIASQVIQDGIPGVPRNADSILDMLVERGLAFMDTQGLYKIAPVVLAVKIPDIKLNCIRLRDDTLVSADPLASVEGRLIGQDADGTPAAEATQSVPQTPGVGATAAAAEATPPQAGVATSGDVNPNPSAPSLADPSTQEQSKVQKASKSANKSVPIVAGASAQKPTVAQERIDQETGEILPVAETAVADTKQPAIAQTMNAANPPSTQAKKRQAPTKPAVVLDGPVGEALKALADDLKSGVKHWGTHAVVEEDERVLLAWPGAFAGYGLTPSAIINDLSARNWCWADPMIPTKKVVEVTIGGVEMRAVRLHHDVSEALLYAAKLDGGKVGPVVSPVPVPSQAPPEHEPKAETGSAASAKSTAGDGGQATKNDAPAQPEGQALPRAKRDARPQKETAQHEELSPQVHTPQPSMQAPAKRKEPTSPIGGLEQAESSPNGHDATDKGLRGDKKPKKEAAPTPNEAATRSKPVGRAANLKTEPPSSAAAKSQPGDLLTADVIEQRKLEIVMAVIAKAEAKPLDGGWFEVPVQRLLGNIKAAGLEFNRGQLFALQEKHPEQFKVVARSFNFRK